MLLASLTEKEIVGTLQGLGTLRKNNIEDYPVKFSAFLNSWKSKLQYLQTSN